MLTDEYDLKTAHERKDKGKDIDRGGNDRSKEANEMEEKGLSKQEEDEQSTIEVKQKTQRDLLVEMLPLLRLWAMPGEMLQHIETLPALASVPGTALASSFLSGVCIAG
jgi:hypothetical protein